MIPRLFNSLPQATAVSTSLSPVNTDPLEHDELIDPKAFRQITGQKRSSHYLKLSESSAYHDPTYPRPIKVGPRTNRFSKRAALEWVKQKVAESERLGASAPTPFPLGRQAPQETGK